MVEGGDPQPGGDDAPDTEPATPATAPPRANLLAGYAVAALAVVLATIAVVALIASIGGGSDGDAVEPDPTADVTVRDPGDDLLPDGGLFNVPDEVENAKAGATAADCELKTFKVRTRDHISSGESVRYPMSPPTSGRHDPVPAPDGAYSVSPKVERLVHTLEHSRVIIWFRQDLPARTRASLKAYYDHDTGLMVLVPDTTGMDYEVAATAWTRDPGRHGTGRLLGCREYNDDVYTALEAFKDAYRGRGLERVP